MDVFSNAEDEQLVHLISNHQQICNPKHKAYKLQTIKDSIWKEISENLNKNAAACKKRWKNIRDNYYKYKKNTKQPTGSAAFGNRKRNPLLDQLGFLDIVEHERRVLTNTDTQITATQYNTDTETQVDDMHLSAEEDNTRESLNDESLGETPFEIPKDTNKKTTEIKSATKVSNNSRIVLPQKRKRYVGDAMLSVLNKNMAESETLMNQLTSASSEPPEDDIDVLFKSLAITVKKFPPSLRAQTKNKLFQVISEAELELLTPRPIQPPSQLSNYSDTSTTNSPLQSPPNWENQEHQMGNCNHQDSDITNFFNYTIDQI